MPTRNTIKTNERRYAHTRHNTAALWRASELWEEAEEDAVEEEDGEAEVALGVGERVEGGAEGGGWVGAEEERREERYHPGRRPERHHPRPQRSLLVRRRVWRGRRGVAVREERALGGAHGG